jgi:hypothetical protein
VISAIGPPVSSMAVSHRSKSSGQSTNTPSL